jgi:hypothetical protein
MDGLQKQKEGLKRFWALFAGPWRGICGIREGNLDLWFVLWMVGADSATGLGAEGVPGPGLGEWTLLGQRFWGSSLHVCGGCTS